MYTCTWTQAGLHSFERYTVPLISVAVFHTEHVFTAHIGIQKCAQIGDQVKNQATESNTHACKHTVNMVVFCCDLCISCPVNECWL